VFAPRCPFHEPRCTAGAQPLITDPDGSTVRCWKADMLGAWPGQHVAAVAEPTFHRGDALVDGKQVGKYLARRDRDETSFTAGSRGAAGTVRGRRASDSRHAVSYPARVEGLAEAGSRDQRIAAVECRLGYGRDVLTRPRPQHIRLPARTR